MTKPVVLIAEELSQATVEALGPDFEIRTTDGADREQLLSAIADVDAILIRSATQMDAEAIGAAQRLKVIARAGVGLDNVDIKAATAAGVMVVNAPTSNVISAAELTVGHILGLARNIAAADASMRQGQWKRSAYAGVELYEKTVGIIGLGRIGGLVAERIKAFGTEVIAYDPFVTSARASSLGVELVELDELLRRSDFITIHMPRTPETLGMLNAESFRAMKHTAFVINVARGGLVDEADLAEALRIGEIAGAAIDVFVNEPAQDVPFIGMPSVVTTPHLGASTAEAQEKAGVSVARSVRLALEGDLVPDAVNVAGGAIDDEVRPGVPLAENLGRILTSLCGDEAFTRVEVKIAGEISTKDVTSLKLAALKGVFTDVVSEKVSYVNAPVIAEQRGIEVELVTTEHSEDFRNEIILSAALSAGGTLQVAGTVTGPKHAMKLTGVNGYELEIPLADNLLVMEYEDRPGVVASIGMSLGKAQVNIAGMQVSRASKGDTAVAVLALDSAPGAEVVAEIEQIVEAQRAASVNLAE
ncbi:phosphoglycerate dehydrogenase [Rothia sp. LK2588]|uniref:phosphoglycerate dehydrogenase n=1 Tax=Rothia sp. LK2588 TaxID=3114369 RepID=UPI0034CECC08